MKQVQVKTNKDKFFRQFLELIRSIPPINKLRPKELDVLAEIMYQNDKYSDLEDNIRHKVVFDTATRKEMRLKVGISADSFNNNLSILRKHKLLTKQNILMPFLETVRYSDGYKLEFKFKAV